MGREGGREVRRGGDSRARNTRWMEIDVIIIIMLLILLAKLDTCPPASSSTNWTVQ